MATRMLIDARHPEETRVAVLKGNRIDEFDFESADRKQIKGNIYLAKVTRVEPSLQAAFVDFGGNRHGFLAFSEIHPDYYQIPKQDREALLAEEAAHAEEEAALRASEGDDDDDDDDHDHGDHADDDMHDNGGVTEVDTSEKDEVATIDGGTFENGEEEDEGESEGEDGNRRGRGRRRQSKGRSKEADELRAKRMALRRRYKIQDVIHRRQVLLVQVVKEERGNKGAALTTYLSLAGRYCVLMPNSSHGGGISRKISSASDRKRLKQIISEMQLPRSMGCIVRTAGLSRTKTEIKRDFDYLARLWDDLRESTLRSSAPALIHSDSDLIKRAIRDIYNRDIEEVVVEGEEGYRAAKDFMKLLMPSHGRKVKPYSDPVPLFQRYGAEDQLTAMYDPVVQLKSGGYIVINPTEALVSIDINSGRSTKEYGIEATALNTNLEAAHEIARQLRLRDMAGLVVIDFIDMEYGSNVRKVEKAVKDALKNDRARIQVGRISSFGLMEMSRQRLRTGVLEATTRSCPHCDGTGLVRTASSAGLSALRLIEDEAAKGRGSIITLFASTEAAVYMLNAKRSDLADIEFRYGVSVEVIPEGENEGAKMRVASSGPRLENPPVFQPIIDLDEDDEDYPEEDEIDEAEEAEANAEASSDDAAGRKRRKRRRGGRNRDRRDERDAEGGQDTESEDDADAEGDTDQDGEATGGAAPESDGETVSEDGEAPRKRRRRGGRRRRGRGRGEDNGEGQIEGEAGEQNFADGPEPEAEPEAEAETAASESVVAEEAAEAPAKPRRTRRRKVEPVEEAAAPEATPVEAAPVEEAAAEAPAEKPKRTRRKKADVAAVEAVAAPEPEAPVEAAEKPKRGRRKKADIVEAAPEAAPEAEVPSGATAEEPAAKPKRTRRAKAVAADAPAEPAAVAPADTPTETQLVGSGERNDDEEGEDGQPRRGWWQRTFGN